MKDILNKISNYKHTKLILIIIIVILIIITLTESLIILNKKEIKINNEVPIIDVNEAINNSEEENEELEKNEYFTQIKEKIKNIKDSKEYNLSIQNTILNYETKNDNLIFSFNNDEYYIKRYNDNKTIYDTEIIQYYYSSQKKMTYVFDDNNNLIDTYEYQININDSYNFFNESIFNNINNFKTINKNDNIYTIEWENNLDNRSFLNKYFNFSIYDNLEDISSINMIIETDDSNINSIKIEVLNKNNKVMLQNNLGFSKLNNNTITLENDIKELINYCDTITEKEFEESFNIELNGNNHSVKIKYNLELNTHYDFYSNIDNHVSIFLDNKLLLNNIYDSIDDLSNESVKTISKYTINDIKYKIKKENFNFIKGSDNNDYFGIKYSLSSTLGEEVEDFSIFNEKGDILRTLNNKFNKPNYCQIHKINDNYIWANFSDPNHVFNGYVEIIDGKIKFYSYNMYNMVNNQELNGIVKLYQIDINNSNINYKLLETYNNVKFYGMCD